MSHKVSTFLAYFHNFKITFISNCYFNTFLWKFTRNFTRKYLVFWSVGEYRVDRFKMDVPDVTPFPVMDGYSVMIFQIWYNSTCIQGSKARPCCPFQVQRLRPNALSLEELKNFLFVDDNIIANLATKLPAHLAAAEVVGHSSEDNRTSCRVNEFNRNVYNCE